MKKRRRIVMVVAAAAAVAGELLLNPIANPMALFFWFAGIFFGVLMFIKAVQLTFQKQGAVRHA